jgi:hypothetical protein
MGKRAEKLQAEKSHYELGFTIQTRRLYGRVHVFNAELLDPIVRALFCLTPTVFPVRLPGFQYSDSSLSPAAATRCGDGRYGLRPRAVKAVNDGQQRFYGLESLLNTTFLRPGR